MVRQEPFVQRLPSKNGTNVKHTSHPWPDFFLHALWVLRALSTQSVQRKAVDLDHIIILNGLPFKFHSKFIQIF